MSDEINSTELLERLAKKFSDLIDEAKGEIERLREDFKDDRRMRAENLNAQYGALDGLAEKSMSIEGAIGSLRAQIERLRAERDKRQGAVEILEIDEDGKVHPLAPPPSTAIKDPDA